MTSRHSIDVHGTAIELGDNGQDARS